MKDPIWIWENTQAKIPYWSLPGTGVRPPFPIILSLRDCTTGSPMEISRWLFPESTPSAAGVPTTLPTGKS